MEKLNIRKSIIILLHAFVGWALCGAIIAVGKQVTSMETTLVLHAIGAPVIFAVLSFFYVKKFSFTSPLQTATFFLLFVAFMDLFVVALFIERSFEMFGNILGTWIPFALIFLSTYLTAAYAKKRTTTEAIV